LTLFTTSSSFFLLLKSKSLSGSEFFVRAVVLRVVIRAVVVRIIVRVIFRVVRVFRFRFLLLGRCLLCRCSLGRSGLGRSSSSSLLCGGSRLLFLFIAGSIPITVEVLFFFFVLLLLFLFITADYCIFPVIFFS